MTKAQDPKPEDDVKEDDAPKGEGMAKMKCPDNVTSCSVEGTEYKADKTGHVKVPAKFVDHLAQFGFTNVA